MKMFISVLAAILTAAAIFAGIYYFAVTRLANKRQREVERQESAMARRSLESIMASQKNLDEIEARNAKKSGVVNPK